VKYIFSLILVIAGLTAGVAQPVLQLTEKHLQKVMGQDNPVKKRRAYLKFYHKDSLRYVKEVDRYWQAKFDSTTNNFSEKRDAAKQSVAQALNRVKDPVKRFEAGIYVAEETYKFSPALESRYSRQKLAVMYSSARFYLTEMSLDTAGLLTQLFRENRSLLQAGVPGVDQINRPTIQIPEVGKELSSFTQNMKGQLNEKISDNSNLKEVKELKEDANKHLVEFKQYEQYANMTPDSLMQAGVNRLKKEGQDRLMSAAGATGLQGKMSDFTQLQSQYKSQLDNLQDSAARKEMAKKKAEELAMDYLANNPGMMKGVQEKVNLLMKKYSMVTNSNDLSTAVKRTSLEDRTTKERLVFAANFQLLTIYPIAVDFAPQMGYRFNSRFTMGLGATYRKTFSDSIPTLAPEVFGYKGFISYDVVKEFFAYGEFAQNSSGLQIQEGTSKRIWTPAAFVGAGRRFSVHKKVDMTVVALYNFLHKQGDPIYPRPFVVRFGFQLSELALLKSKPAIKY